MQICKNLIFKCHHILRYKERLELQHMNLGLIAFLAFYILNWFYDYLLYRCLRDGYWNLEFLLWISLLLLSVLSVFASRVLQMKLKGKDRCSRVLEWEYPIYTQETFSNAVSMKAATQISRISLIGTNIFLRC